MPVTITGDTLNSKNNAVLGKEFDYSYPDGMGSLAPKAKKHNDLVSKVMTRAQAAFQHISKRHSDWRNIDKVLKAYVTPEDLKKEKKDGSYDKIIVPVSYVTLETILTYYMNAFLQDPVWEFTGTGPEDNLRAAFHTGVLDRHFSRFNMGMSLHTAWRDMTAYGIGGSHPIWHKELITTTKATPDGNRSKSNLQIAAEGNKLMPINPYRLILDPHVPAHTPQEGEFIGWVTRTTYPVLRKMEMNSKGTIFNVKYLTKIEGRSHTFSPHEDHHTLTNDSMTNPVDILWFYIDLIPSEWDMGSSVDPEKWLFAVAGDSLLISARPVGLNHGQFPVALGAPDTDGYTSSPSSRLGLIHDMQEHINFLFSSHIENVKRSVNNELIYDPYMIREDDMMDGKPGKRIRLRKAAWGRGKIQDYVHQLQIQDLTVGNMSDVAFLRAMANETSGAQNAVSGNTVNQGPRISANQAQSDRLSQIARLETDAIKIGWQYMQPLGRMMSEHTMQFMTEEVSLNTTGDMEKVLRATFEGKRSEGSINVGYKQLLGRPLDIRVHDGTVPGREDANAWIQFLQAAGQIPSAIATLDMPRLITHIARQLGAKSVDSFVNTGLEVTADEVVNQQIQAGNLVDPSTV